MRKGALLGLGLFLVALLAGVVLALTGDADLRTAPGTRVGGVSAERLDRAALTALVASLDGKAPQQVTVELGARRWSAPREQLGMALDVEQTVERVLQTSPDGRTWGFLGMNRGEDVTPVLRRDNALLDTATAALVARATVAESHGQLRANGTALAVVPPAAGQRASEDAVRKALEQAGTRLPFPAELSVPVEVLPPHNTVADLEPLAAAARRVLAQPVVLKAGSRTAPVDRPRLARLIRVGAQGEGPGHPLVLQLAPEAATQVAAPVAKALGTDAQEPRIAAPEPASLLREKGTVTWKPVPASTSVVASGRAGQSVEPRAVLDALTARLQGSAPTQDLPLTAVPPKVSDAQAKTIDAVLGTFTTAFACCQPRVKNITLIAKTIDGTVIAPGESFSLNGIVGPRTRAGGYVEAPYIVDGELSMDVGGGVSQFATTTLNAAFFAGVRLERHQAHSFYISRYPPGREATVNYPSIDLRWRNDTAWPVLVRTKTTSTSLTVTLYGHNDGRTVRGVSGPRQPVPGRDFRITITRTVSVPGRKPQTDSFTTTYNKPPQGE